MWVWSLALLCSAVSNGVCFCRPLVTSTTTFRACVFRGCQSDEDGGAISVENRSITLGIGSCLFTDCRAPLGGGISSLCFRFSIDATSALNCSAELFGGFCIVAMSESGAIYVRETSASCCSCMAGTLALGPDREAEAEPLLLLALNSTTNNGSVATGLVAMDAVGCSIRYSAFCSNSPGNCVAMATTIPYSDISCLGFLNNTCTADAVPSLLFCGSALAISDSIFQSNTFAYFVMAEPVDSWRPEPAVALHRCIFDCDSVNHTGVLKLYIRSCEFRANTAVAVGPGVCPPTGQSSGPSQTAAVVVLSVVAVVAASIGAIVAVFVLRRRRQADEAGDGLVEHPEHPID
jgi:hypothetical protein